MVQDRVARGPLPPVAAQVLGLVLLFMSLCFDGGTGAYEDKLMCSHHVGPFDLMFNIQFAKVRCRPFAVPRKHPIRLHV